MILVDRVAIGAFLLFVLFLYVVGQRNQPTLSAAQAWALAKDSAEIVGLTIWLPLRIIDFILAGRIRISRY